MAERFNEKEQEDSQERQKKKKTDSIRQTSMDDFDIINKLGTNNMLIFRGWRLQQCLQSQEDC